MASFIQSLAAVLRRILKDAISALRILREAFGIPSKNRQLVLGVILLVLPYPALYLLYHFLVYPYLYAKPESLLSNKLLRGAPAMTTEHNILLLVNYLFENARWALDFFTVLITTFATLATCSGEHLSCGELLMRFGRDWRGPVLTGICIQILQGGYWSFVDTFTYGLLVQALLVLFSVSFDILYYYLDAVWESSLAASVADGCSWFSSLGLAAQLTKGRRLRGFFLIFFCRLLNEAINRVRNLSYGIPITSAARVALAACLTCLPNLLNMLRAAAIAVFYHECRADQSHEEESQYTTLC